MGTLERNKCQRTVGTCCLAEKSLSGQIHIVMFMTVFDQMRWARTYSALTVMRSSLGAPVACSGLPPMRLQDPSGTTMPTWTQTKFYFEQSTSRTLWHRGGVVWFAP